MVVLNDMLLVGIFFTMLTFSYKFVEICKAQNEMRAYQMISEAKKMYLSNMAESENESIKNVLIEEVCNAYDVFCGLFLDGVISKKRFCRGYGNEIISWVEASSSNAHEHYTNKTDFESTIRAYEILKKNVK